jgi:hypothetical protein
MSLGKVCPSVLVIRYSQTDGQDQAFAVWAFKRRSAFWYLAAGVSVHPGKNPPGNNNDPDNYQSSSFRIVYLSAQNRNTISVVAATQNKGLHRYTGINAVTDLHGKDRFAQVAIPGG